jgi:hypothetical protein
MKRVPKLGDEVYVIDRNSCGERGRFSPGVSATVTKIGSKYFYCGNYTFEIDSFCDGSWVDKNNSGCGWHHNCDAYLSCEIYEKMRLKRKRIDEIQGVEMLDWSCKKVQELHALAFGSPDLDGAEEWEVTDDG